MSRFDYDVVILGSGMGGSLLGILCRAIGLRVLLVEKGDHPRFSIGETVGGEVLRRLDYLAERYNVSLLSDLSSYCRIKKAGLPVATWPKVHGTFIRHELGKRVDPVHPEEIMVQASSWPLGPDAHVYRPDFDLFLKNQAVERGATYLPHTESTAYRFDPESGSSIDLRSKDGQSQTVTCRLLVDATGPARWLSRQLGIIREDSAIIPMASAAIFAHFRNAKPWEVVCGGPKLAFPRDQGTLLHVGALGLVWVIPFDNGITSAGWVTSERLPSEGTPEELFWNAINQYPSLAEQLKGAEVVTNYYRVDRLQYSAERVAGDGWFLMPASAEFSDPLFSVGMPLTLAAITRLARRLEQLDRDKPVMTTDLADLETRFRAESEYIRKFTIATKKCFLDFGLLHRAVNLYRLVIFREGGYIHASDPEAADAAAFGVDDPKVREIIDAFYQCVMEIDFSAPISEATRERLDDVIRRRDVDGFGESAWGKLRDDGVYVNSIPQMVHYFWKARHLPLGLGNVDGFRRVSGRWLRSFPDLLRNRGDGTQPLPRGLIRDQLRAMVRL